MMIKRKMSKRNKKLLAEKEAVEVENLIIKNEIKEEKSKKSQIKPIQTPVIPISFNKKRNMRNGSDNFIWTTNPTTGDRFKFYFKSGHQSCILGRYSETNVKNEYGESIFLPTCERCYYGDAYEYVMEPRVEESSDSSRGKLPTKTIFHIANFMRRMTRIPSDVFYSHILACSEGEARHKYLEIINFYSFDEPFEKEYYYGENGIKNHGYLVLYIKKYMDFLALNLYTKSFIACLTDLSYRID